MPAEWLELTNAFCHAAGMTTFFHVQKIKLFSHIPYMKLCQHALTLDPMIDTKWTEHTFKSVDWQPNGSSFKALALGSSSFKALALGRQFEISKSAHEWTPTMHHQA
jgi:hypothetical protein